MTVCIYRYIHTTALYYKRSEEEKGKACKEMGKISGSSAGTKFGQLFSKIVEAPMLPFS